MSRDYDYEICHGGPQCGCSKCERSYEIEDKVEEARREGRADGYREGLAEGLRLALGEVEKARKEWRTLYKGSYSASAGGAALQELLGAIKAHLPLL